MNEPETNYLWGVITKDPAFPEERIGPSAWTPSCGSLIIGGHDSAAVVIYAPGAWTKCVRLGKTTRA